MAAHILMNHPNPLLMPFFFIFTILIFAFIILIIAKKLYFYKDSSVGSRNEYVDELKDQLDEIINESNNNLISEEELNTARLEIDKRILKEIRYEKNKSRKTEKAPTLFNNIFLYLGLPFLIICTSIIYLKIGYYGFEDHPQKTRNLKKEANFASRLNQQQAELLLSQTLNNESLTQQNIENQQLKILVDRLEIILRDRPKDLKGYNLLIDNAARLGDYKTSYQSQMHVIETIKPKVTAEDYGQLAELMIGATNGYVSVEAEENIKKSLHIDRSNQKSRYYYGLLKLQNNKLNEGYTIWKELLREGPEDAPWNQLIKQDIHRIEKKLSESTKKSKNYMGEEMDQDTVEMINEMVFTLSERLKTEGGTYEEWLKLIRSYQVLGKPEQAFEILKKAKRYFKEQPDVLKKFQRIIP
ncbi:MAG: c-type cytochrome biogenesis protein CcmI [Rhodobacteraceae bacterium]|nr:MAG: c-type cytochrome biogenesis protein CcmI [Paracoccaceae bacterium]